MLITYLATVEQSHEGPYAVSFPDLPGCYAQAQTFAEIQREAQEALASFLYAAKHAGLPVAPPSPSLECAKGQTALLVSVDLERYARQQDTRPVKKTISLPAWMAEGADRAGLSLSKVLQETLRSRLNDAE